MLASALATLILGALSVRPILESLEMRMVHPWGCTIPAPSWMEQGFWDAVWKRQGGGGYLGFIEQIIFFASFWTDGWPLLAAWLAFKVACQWESWKHSDGLIDLAKKQTYKTGDEKQNAIDLLAIQRWVSVRYMSFLVGTGANIVIALATVAAGRTLLRYLEPGLNV